MVLRYHAECVVKQVLYVFKMPYILNTLLLKALKLWHTHVHTYTHKLPQI